MNALRRSVLAGMTIVALGLAGCATKKPVPPGTVTPTRPATGAEAALSPQRYMAVAASSALLSLRSSELAGARASGSRLRAFAAQAVSDQRGIGSQLSFAGRRLDLLPAATLSPLHQSMYDELAASADFDATYRGQQRIVLAQSHAVHRNFARRGASATLRPVAAMAEPVLRRHLEALRRL